MLEPLAILTDIGTVLVVAIKAMIGSLRLAPANSPGCLLSPLTQPNKVDTQSSSQRDDSESE